MVPERLTIAVVLLLPLVRLTAFKRWLVEPVFKEIVPSFIILPTNSTPTLVPLLVVPVKTKLLTAFTVKLPFALAYKFVPEVVKVELPLIVTLLGYPGPLVVLHSLKRP